jgi:hypothetical protein
MAGCALRFRSLSPAFSRRVSLRCWKAEQEFHGPGCSLRKKGSDIVRKCLERLCFCSPFNIRGRFVREDSPDRLKDGTL